MGNKLDKEILEGKYFLMAKNVIAKKIKKTNYQHENKLMKKQWLEQQMKPREDV